MTPGRPALRLHSYRRCPFAIWTRVTLHEKGLSFELIEEDLKNFSPELLRLHPEGLVPLLVHRLSDGRELVVHESAIITEYLEEAFPHEPKLMPADAAARAEVRLWTYWCNHLFKPDLDAYKYELRELAVDGREALLARLRGHLEKWEKALTPSGFMVGAGLTLADIHLFPFYRQLTKVTPAALDLKAYSRLSIWLEAMTSRPSFIKAMS